MILSFWSKEPELESSERNERRFEMDYVRDKIFAVFSPQNSTLKNEIQIQIVVKVIKVKGSERNSSLQSEDDVDCLVSLKGIKRNL